MVRFAYVCITPYAERGMNLLQEGKAMNNQSETKETAEDITRSGGSGRSSGFIILIAVILIFVIALTSLITFSYTINQYCQNADGLSAKLQTVSKLLDEYAYYSPQAQEMIDAAIKAYVGAAGDKYTVYYNAEEFDALTKENEGKYVGIGVTVQEAYIQYLGREITVLEVVRIAVDSPAAASDTLAVGDYIYAVDTVEGLRYIDEVGRDVAAEYVRGEAGTTVKILWLSETEEGYVLKDGSFTRKEVLSASVSSRVSQISSSVGVVSIYQFDLTTPTQFCAAVDSLREKGIERIVLDLRDNGGGDLLSVIACASYFLEPHDVIITSESKNGTRDERRAVERIFSDSYAPCSVKKDEIGKYRDLHVAVLVNGNTASAAELLSAVFRDYGLAPIIGTKTFGKGSMQTLIPLLPYGMDGGIKMTTHLYYPPSGEGYNGIGITPDITVEPQGDFIISDAHETKDNQLNRAVEELLKTLG